MNKPDEIFDGTNYTVPGLSLACYDSRSFVPVQRVTNADLDRLGFRPKLTVSEFGDLYNQSLREIQDVALEYERNHGMSPLVIELHGVWTQYMASAYYDESEVYDVDVHLHPRWWDFKVFAHDMLFNAINSHAVTSNLAAKGEISFRQTAYRPTAVYFGSKLIGPQTLFWLTKKEIKSYQRSLYCGPLTKGYMVVSDDIRYFLDDVSANGYSAAHPGAETIEIAPVSQLIRHTLA